MSSGTGGTLGGTSKFIKEKRPEVKVVLADPPGSGLYGYVKHGELKGEGSSITEGIGIMRLTHNFKQGIVDDAVQVIDRSVVQMAHWLLRNEGLFVGSSSALNIWAAAQVARSMSPGARVVTFACDGGQRYQSRLFADDWLSAKGLAPSEQSLEQILETMAQ